MNVDSAPRRATGIDSRLELHLKVIKLLKLFFFSPVHARERLFTYSLNIRELILKVPKPEGTKQSNRQKVSWSITVRQTLEN
ncbi:hypothetical protein PUN28_015519 [Cardiocondyla obscurior]|uniref:Ribosomal protein S10 n=1 Tax=Cardiocondyla obscurior TaxID=286306 RepID=A0AAW2EYN0_9HYME